MTELVREGKTRFISLSECSAQSLRCGSVVHPLASLQMEYSLFSRDAEEQGQIEACRELGMAMMAYAVLGRGMLSAEPATLGNSEPTTFARGCPASRAPISRQISGSARRSRPSRAAKNATLAELAIAWPMARGAQGGTFIVPIPGAKSRKHLEENVRAAEIVLAADDFAAIDRVAPPGAASGTRYQTGQMDRLNR